ncbi:hypothetical protein LJR255_002310 [Pararhizobium sp. LjRoot255]|uniref:hypothetical protein n=1 Tax=Pararhizobium sp. LjRoot255 TaxID=3342298 RepID=UPI003ECD5A6A
MNAFRSNRGNTARMDLLPPDRPQRSAQTSSASRATDIIDADFETVTANSRRNVYPVFNDHCRAAPRQQTRAAVGQSRAALVLLWAVNHLERLLQTASPKAFAVLVTCLCAPVFLLFAGLSHHQPAVAASPGLAISGVTAALSDANGMKVVSVYGAVENLSDAPKAVPMIQVDVIAGGQKRTASRIFSGEPVLAPGESRPFSARLPHAGGKLPDVTVSFGEKGDSAP